MARGPVAPSGPGSPALALNFFRAGLLLSLLAGMLPGAWLLGRLAATRSFAALPTHWVQVHGQAQIMGLLICFIFGFSYQAFPRFRGMQLQMPGLARASLPLLVGGLVLRFAGSLLADTWAGGRWVATLGALLELAAVVLFFVVMGVTSRQESPRTSRPGAASHAGYVIAAAGWLLISALAGVAQAWFIAGEPEGSIPLIARLALWEQPFLDVQLHGVILIMIAGVSLRLVPAFLGLPPLTSERPLRWLPWLNLAVLAEAVGDVWVARTGSTAAMALREAAVLTLGVGALALILPVGLYSRQASTAAPRPFLRGAWTWLAVSFLLLASPPLYGALLHRGGSHGLMDAARHAFTMGFALMVLMGISSMVVPSLALQPRMSRRVQMWAWALLNISLALRVGGDVLTDFTDAGYGLSGLSGVTSLAAFLCWAVPLWIFIHRRPRLEGAPGTAGRASPA